MSACVWNEGAQQNIVTIPPKSADSTSGGSGGGPGGAAGGGGSGTGNTGSSKGSHLSGGAIAGIVVGCVIFALLIAAALTVLLLRKRRKWMKAGYAVAAPKIEPDEAVLKGPVFNSAPPTTDSSTPFSAADLSAPRSNVEYSSSGGSPAAPIIAPVPVSAAAPATGILAAASGGNGPGDTTPELDGRHVQPRAELDSTEIPVSSTHPLAQNPIVHEAPGSAVAGGLHRPEPNREISTVGDLPSFGGRQDKNGDSPEVSTLGSNSAIDERDSSVLVSPTTPVHPDRPF